MSTGKKTARIDKILGHLGYGSRADIKKMTKQGRVTLGGATIKDSGTQVNPYTDVIEVDGDRVVYREFIYIMLHKPAGVISATEDKRERTVIDLLPTSYRNFEPFPVGRLDKDTEGLLLLTNDGQLAHQLLSPRKHVAKTYEAKVIGRIGESVISEFANGVTLDDGYETMPAELVIQDYFSENDEPMSNISVTIMEGKFHQVKRMFEAVGSKVVYLKRVSMGPLTLDDELPLGSFRELSDVEMNALGIQSNT